ncbi:GerAB/ArcD/ProY family transporter [Neobacillus sp. OS1-33]|jgi:spore germination protein (amino acid permease)|uniref:GerAB/ArcD/ProY family transporter n=1 Tax=Neobacillus sp. OS1-33 TaxID=3070683 RepID=UPI0027E209BE|nr:GerAB/ArcD/ProY family transporter [Neobacillus sp. OS1-33]WML27201.1 GerAB/ArcD/ProY family transporter [Neobacillus sp. OS1-33]
MIHLEKISINQLICLVILTQVGVSVLTVPYAQIRDSGNDSWMSILIGGVIAQAVILIIYQLGKRYADRPLPQYISTIVGKPLGSVLNFLFAVYFAQNGLMVIITYTDVINRWVLFETPWSVLIGVSFTIGAYIASSTLRSMATITQMIMLMFLICFVIVLISGLSKEIDFRHILPIGTHGIGPIIKGALPSFWLYSGYEHLMYVFPFVRSRKKKDILMAISAANGFTTFFYLLITVLVTSNFSENQLKSIPEPMVFILRVFNWPIVHSLDILFMTIWLSVVLVTQYVYLFIAARHLAFIRGKEIRNHSLLVWILAIVCFGAGLWCSDRQLQSRILDYHNIVTGIMIAIVPTILLLISLARGKAAGV